MPKTINSGLSDYWFSYKEPIENQPIIVYDLTNRIYCNRYQSFSLKSFSNFTSKIIRRGIIDINNGQYYFGNPWQ